jgi:cytochrome c-type protein NapC
MKDSDSRECRNCHSFEGMNSEVQKPRARKQHELAQRDKETCIDCHKGIAHQKPKGMKEEDDE